MAVSRKEDVKWFGNFAAASRWRFAKTYVQSYPHEYTLDEWCDEADFDRAIQCIERYGAEHAFYCARRKYLYVDERMYWHMGDVRSSDPDDRPGLINRSWTDVGRYREEARKLGYGEDDLNRLVVRWQVLLARAMGAGSAK